MIFWLIVAIVVSLSIGFVMGARFRQYRPIKPMQGCTQDAWTPLECQARDESHPMRARDAFLNHIGNGIKF